MRDQLISISCNNNAFHLHAPALLAACVEMNEFVFSPLNFVFRIFSAVRHVVQVTLQCLQKMTHLVGPVLKITLHCHEFV